MDDNLDPARAWTVFRFTMFNQIKHGWGKYSYSFILFIIDLYMCAISLSFLGPQKEIIDPWWGTIFLIDVKEKLTEYPFNM